MPHFFPQVPQLDVSVLVFTHFPPQQLGNFVNVHEFLQAPQFDADVLRFTQVPPQFVWPLPKHLKPPVPSPEPDPDVVVSVVTSVVGSVVTPAGAVMQVDALQIMPAEHMFPQMPQFSVVDERS